MSVHLLLTLLSRQSLSRYSFWIFLLGAVRENRCVEGKDPCCLNWAVYALVKAAKLCNIYNLCGNNLVLVTWWFHGNHIFPGMFYKFENLAFTTVGFCNIDLITFESFSEVFGRSEKNKKSKMVDPRWRPLENMTELPREMTSLTLTLITSSWHHPLLH